MFCWDTCRRDICCGRLSGERREEKTSETMPRMPEWVTIPWYIFDWLRRFHSLILLAASRLFTGRLVCLMFSIRSFRFEKDLWHSIPQWES